MVYRILFDAYEKQGFHQFITSLFGRICLKPSFNTRTYSILNFQTFSCTKVLIYPIPIFRKANIHRIIISINTLDTFVSFVPYEFWQYFGLDNIYNNLSLILRKSYHKNNTTI